MQVAGIIAEWNPLHRGHLLPLREARRRGATHIVAILSGNYVQRGEPALCPWPYRAAAALHSGVDLVWREVCDSLTPGFVGLTH